MAEHSSEVTVLSDREISITRTFDAPRELVFRAWTEPNHLMRWWAPPHFTTPHCTVDLRPGGVWHYCFRSPDGQDSWSRAIYHEVVPPERLVYADAFSDAEGNVLSPEMLIMVTFAEQDSRTVVTIWTLFESREHRDEVLGMRMVEGMMGTLDRLAELLATMT